MNQSKIYNFLIQNVSALDGVGIKTKKLLKKKKIEKIYDLLWNLPQGFTDRSNVQTLDKLEIGKITTIKVKVTKYNFPRVRNLPNKVFCEDETGKIECIFFNSFEGYIKKILPINSNISTNEVINTNYCHVSVCKSKHKNKLIILSAIDNLIKGGAGQAVQNLNYYFGYNVKKGLL